MTAGKPRIPTASPESPTSITGGQKLTQSMPAIEAVFTAIIEARVYNNEDVLVINMDDPFYDEVGDVRQLCRALLEMVPCSEAVYLLTLIFIDRIRAKGVVVHERNAHGILSAAFVLAAKWHMDEWPGVSSVAALMGVTTRRLALVERHFLNIIQHRLLVHYAQFERHVANHVREAIMSPTSGRAVRHILRVERIVGI